MPVVAEQEEPSKDSNCEASSCDKTDCMSVSLASVVECWC
jgi:hypothetical protein